MIEKLDAKIQKEDIADEWRSLKLIEAKINQIIDHINGQDQGIHGWHDGDHYVDAEGKLHIFQNGKWD